MYIFKVYTPKQLLKEINQLFYQLLPMPAIREKEKRRFIILLDLHFSFGAYLPMQRENEAQNKNVKTSKIIYIIF